MLIVLILILLLRKIIMIIIVIITSEMTMPMALVTIANEKRYLNTNKQTRLKNNYGDDFRINA